MRAVVKKIGILWFLYLVIVNSYLLILDLFRQVDVKDHTIKEVCFALWGWGWDGMHYLKIATQSYEFPLQAFFPLYPLLIRFLDFFLPLTFAYRINAILLLPVLFLSYLLMSYINIEEKKRIKVLIIFLAFPTAFFLQANYVECLYILLSIAGLLLLLKKKYFWAALFAGFLSAVKISGISLGFIIALFYIFDVTENFKYLPKNLIKHIGKLVIISMLSLSGFLGYMFYLNSTEGSYNIFFKAQYKWGRESFSGKKDLTQIVTGYYLPIVKAVKNQDSSLFRRFCEVGSFIMSLVLLWISRKKLKMELWLFSFFQIFIPISSGTFLSFNRLVLLAYPLLFFGFSLFADKKFYYFSSIAIFALLQGVGIYLFFNNVFIG